MSDLKYFVCFIVRPFVVSGDIVLFAGAEMFVSLIRNAERVIGVELEPVDSVYRGFLDRKLQSVWDDSGHPMHALLSGRVSLRHSGRLRLPSLATNRYREFFTVRAIKLFNEKLQTDCILPSKLS